MLQLIAVKALPGYRLWLEFADGVAGEIDLGHLVGRGVFAAWQDETVFQGVHIGPHGELTWSEEIELCPDALYLALTGRSPEEVFPLLRAEAAYA